MFLTRNRLADRWMLLTTRRPSATTDGMAEKSDSSKTNWETCAAAGLSQILCKHRNAVQIEQNIFKVEVVQAAAALFSK